MPDRLPHFSYLPPGRHRIEIDVLARYESRRGLFGHWVLFGT